jgi:hypothetical protein
MSGNYQGDVSVRGTSRQDFKPKSESIADQYETVAASQTDQALGATGASGDFLKRVIVCVATAATGTCSIKDGAGSAIPLTAANTPIGVYIVDLGMVSSSGAWSVTTGAGATAIGIGNFT